MILIAGDSWGCGEWGVLEDKKHECLAGYFREQGHNVINISVANACNYDIAKSVDSFLDNNKQLLTSIDRILVFQSNWNRDWRRRYDFDIVTDLQQPSYPMIFGRFIHRFYIMLNETGFQYNKKIELIGGCADTIGPDECQDYNFLQVSCQSMVNLLTNGSAKIAKPVHSLWVNNHITQEFIEHLKKILDSKNLNLFLNDIDLGHERLNLMRSMAKYFGGDWHHATPGGHRVLFEFLTQ
jgi:hypothetical protein